MRRENTTLGSERKILKRSGGLFRDEVEQVTRFAFIDAQKAHQDVTAACRLLKVSRSSFYAWRSRPLSSQAVADEVLTDQIRVVSTENRQVYGAPRIHAELAEEQYWARPPVAVPRGLSAAQEGNACTTTGERHYR